MTQINQDLIEKTKERIERLKARLEYLEHVAPIAPTIDELRKAALIDALARTGGNKTYAAAQLAISIRTLRNWVKKYEIENETN